MTSHSKKVVEVFFFYNFEHSESLISFLGIISSTFIFVDMEILTRYTLRLVNVISGHVMMLRVYRDNS